MDSKIKNIIFDLDDTLFDTMGSLVLPAAREACNAMIAKGLNCTLDECLEFRWKLRKSGSREDFFKKTVLQFGVRNGNEEDVYSCGERAFHKRQIKENISLFPGTLEVLKNLKKNYRLFLITIGDPQTQIEKVKLLGLKDIFEKTYFVDGLKDKSKKAAFGEILDLIGENPESFLSVGNRIDTDIKFAKELGMKGVLFEHGEYLHLKPEHKTERPDQIIKSLKELLEWLK